MTRTVRPRQRWNDTERRFGPLTVARDRRTSRYFALVLDSGDEERPGCTLRLSVFGRTLILDCPPILRPYREKVTARSWDAATIERMGRDWYYAEDPRQVGVTISEGGFVSVAYGRQSEDSRTERRWGWFMPWAQWRVVRRRWFGLTGACVSEVREDRVRWERVFAHKSLCPRVRFTFLDYDGEQLEATTHLEEMVWHRGIGWWRWLGWCCPPQSKRFLEITFSGEVGRRKGSWKGGTIGHRITVEPGELHADAFARYAAAHEITILSTTPDRSLALTP